MIPNQPYLILSPYIAIYDIVSPFQILLISLGLTEVIYAPSSKRIFYSIQEYLIHFRVNKACELMMNSELSIGDISRSVGYDDPLLFSKIFKKVKGASPKHFRDAI
ncbi:AraC-like DNA-binding protein [Paenibacillus sp. DS2015]|uniref:helix-turn-helix transcriptional regulator n=1 Tax=Paenibacillus sp. DS2015 TaxID=3373917 RepID=UPI003D1B84EB